jgi:hypothetical protein
MTDVTEALLSAHVEHELGRLRGDALDHLLEEQVAAAFEWLEDVNFHDVVTRDQIVGVIDRYVVELKVSGGITELAGEMSRVVFSSAASGATRVEDILPPQAYGDFADKIAALGGLQSELIRYVTRSAAFGTLASRLFSRMVTDLLFRSEPGRSSPRLTGLIGTLAEKLLPGFERRVGEALSRHIEPHASRLTRDGGGHLLEALDPECVRQIADEIWDEVSKKPLSDAGAFFTAQDLEDFVVLGYEFWQKFRKTRYFRAVSTDVVDRLFEKYGEESVLSVIGDMGVTEQMVAHELKTFIGPLFERAFATGFLEQQVRAYLEPFYRSPAVAAILAR